ncbi:MAG: fluoride efflux transporter CrcB [Gammaproteobacteria bacterium]|nr:fluoride efflux transporter CrcB [Gammaproteobacteria bacterium]
MLKTLMFIAVGGAFGAMMRFLSQATVHELFGKAFPYGTLFVNVTGSFLMGLLSIFLVEKFNLSSEWHLAILVGVLGSFTTFSTFSIETLVLFEQGDFLKAMTNISLSIILCVSAVWVGAYFAKQIV